MWARLHLELEISMARCFSFALQRRTLDSITQPSPDVSCGTWNSANSIHISPGPTCNIVSTVNWFWNGDAYSEPWELRGPRGPVTYFPGQQTGPEDVSQLNWYMSCGAGDHTVTFQKPSSILVSYVQFFKCCQTQRWKWSMQTQLCMLFPFSYNFSPLTSSWPWWSVHMYCLAL